MRNHSWNIPRSTIASVLAVLILSACGGKDKPPTGPAANSVAKVVEGLTVEGGGTATVKTGTAPAASGGPSASVASGASVGQGATGEIIVTSATAFRRIFLSVTGRDGHYEIQLPADVTAATLLATFGTTVSGAVTVNYAVATAAGAVGAPVSANVNIINVGTGDVQVTLTWNTSADVDLHVVEPNLEEIYYSNDASATGGVLDLDSNAGCSGDEVRAENITWNTAPPRGSYIVRVDYWANCSATSTDYVVTVRRKGSATQTFTGNFTGAGDGGSAGDGVLITTFTY